MRMDAAFRTSDDPFAKMKELIQDMIETLEATLSIMSTPFDEESSMAKHRLKLLHSMLTFSS